MASTPSNSSWPQDCVSFMRPLTNGGPEQFNAYVIEGTDSCAALVIQPWRQARSDSRKNDALAISNAGLSRSTLSCQCGVTEALFA